MSVLRLAEHIQVPIVPFEHNPSEEKQKDHASA